MPAAMETLGSLVSDALRLPMPITDAYSFMTLALAGLLTIVAVIGLPALLASAFRRRADSSAEPRADTDPKHYPAPTVQYYQHYPESIQVTPVSELHTTPSLQCHALQRYSSPDMATVGATSATRRSRAESPAPFKIQPVEENQKSEGTHNDSNVGLNYTHKQPPSKTTTSLKVDMARVARVALHAIMAMMPLTIIILLVAQCGPECAQTAVAEIEKAVTCIPIPRVALEVTLVVFGFLTSGWGIKNIHAATSDTEPVRCSCGKMFTSDSTFCQTCGAKHPEEADFKRD